MPTFWLSVAAAQEDRMMVVGVEQVVCSTKLMHIYPMER